MKETYPKQSYALVRDVTKRGPLLTLERILDYTSAEHNRLFTLQDVKYPGLATVSNMRTHFGYLEEEGIVSENSREKGLYSLTDTDLVRIIRDLLSEYRKKPNPINNRVPKTFDRIGMTVTSLKIIEYFVDNPKSIKKRRELAQIIGVTPNGFSQIMAQSRVNSLITDEIIEVDDPIDERGYIYMANQESPIFQVYTQLVDVIRAQDKQKGDKQKVD